MAAAVQRGSVPAAALIETAAAMNPASVQHVMDALEQVQRLDRRMAVLRVRALSRRSAAEVRRCRHEGALLAEHASAILRDLPISRSFVRALAAELQTLDDQLERASRGLRGPADIDRMYAIEERVGMPAESFRQKCAGLRHAESQLAALEEHRLRRNADARVHRVT
jgi:hypothetical protein